MRIPGRPASADFDGIDSGIPDVVERFLEGPLGKKNGKHANFHEWSSPVGATRS